MPESGLDCLACVTFTRQGSATWIDTSHSGGKKPLAEALSANSHPDDGCSLDAPSLNGIRPAPLMLPCGTGGPDVIRKEAWSCYKTISSVRLCWELEKSEGAKGHEERAHLADLGAA